MERTTIAKSVTVQGIGLHRGNEITVHMHPAHKGIYFMRDEVIIPARPEYVSDTRLNTHVRVDHTGISTIEHLMSALYGQGITDCHIEISGDEVPALDGSALPWLEHIAAAGCQGLGSEREPIMIESPLRVEHGDAWISVRPGPFAVEYMIDFPEPAIGQQAFTFTGADYAGQIAPARTFGRLADVEMMRAMGLAMGGGLHNAVVVDGATVLNPEGLRFPDEFVRHKILDLLGDLWLLGRPVIGRFQAYKANHGLHVALARAIADGLPPGEGA